MAVWRLLKKVKIELPYDAMILLLGFYPKKLKSGYRRHLHTDVPHSTILKSQPMETTQMPSN
jgi:hypothetical protein